MIPSSVRTTEPRGARDHTLVPGGSDPQRPWKPYPPPPTERCGKLWIGTSDSVVVYDNDRLMLLPEWLSTIEGLEVDCGPRRPTNGTYFQFNVSKTKKDVSVQPLDLIYRADNYPRAVSTIQIFRPSTEYAAHA